VVVVNKHVFFKWQGEWLKELENRRARRPSWSATDARNFQDAVTKEWRVR
jgi:hypothetical protein